MRRVHCLMVLLAIVTAVAVLGSRAGPRVAVARHDLPPVEAPSSDGPLVGELTLELDKPSYTQSEEITGRITFRVDWRDKAFGAGRTRVWIGDPQLGIAMDESVAIEAMTDTKLVDPVWIGHTYRLSFVVRAAGPLQEYAGEAHKRLSLARPGERRIAARVTPTKGWWSGQIPRYDVLLSITSEWTAFALAPGMRSLAGKEDVLSWIKSPPPAHGRGWYDNDPRQALFAYYQFWKYPLRDLPLFLPPDGVTTLETCARPPLFLLLRPGQEYEIRFADQQPHSLFDGHALTPCSSGEVVLHAPPREGLHAVECKAHSYRIGWLLVVDWAPASGPDDAEDGY